MNLISSGLVAAPTYINSQTMPNLVGRAGVEPAQPQAADLQSVELTYAQPPRILVELTRIELATLSVQGRCSPK